MIIKKRTKPESIAYLQRALVRIPSKRAEINKELQDIEQGYEAEKELDFYLSRIGFDSSSNMILQDLRLPAADGFSFFQIDSLILTPAFALIIDVKSLTGQLYFEHHARKFRYHLHGKQYEMTHPITQLEEQKDQLKNWLGDAYPIYTISALSNQRAQVETDESSAWVHDIVMHFEWIKTKWKEICGKNQDDFFSNSEVTAHAYRLANADCRPQFHYWKKWNLDVSDVRTGVICPLCGKLAMRRLRVTWECPHCKGRDRFAHLNALRDYFALVAPRMTNVECRHFLHLENEHQTRVLLTNHDLLDSRGSTRGRYYFLK
ncbi:nuclease-related domain-containing protein [Gracilibacillus massiliensis]|uniref:nuclease-related domain-containing protein n=1 Tax=Gracilibacillus massiliensis TaxID=1564956 RepID=UPI00071CE3CC|nr:nuclease-related domain-containing protein [Gracilibacillus massiliensis]